MSPMRRWNKRMLKQEYKGVTKPYTASVGTSLGTEVPPEAPNRPRNHPNYQATDVDNHGDTPYPMYGQSLSFFLITLFGILMIVATICYIFIFLYLSEYTN